MGNELTPIQREQLTKDIQTLVERKSLLNAAIKQVIYRISLCEARIKRCDIAIGKEMAIARKNALHQRKLLQELAILKWRAKISRYEAEIARCEHETMLLQSSGI